MKAQSICMLLFVILANEAFPQKIVHESTDQDYSLPGFTLTVKTSGFLNDDDIRDYVYVFDGRSSDGNNSEVRILSVFISTKTGYKKYENSRILFPLNYDGNFPDSLVEISIKDHRLAIEQYGGFSKRWSRETVFAFSPESDELVLQSDIGSLFDTSDYNSVLEERNYLEENENVAFPDYSVF